MLCFGPVAAGKSSFICTLDSMATDRISHLAEVGLGTTSLTRELRKYSVCKGLPVKVFVWDAAGWTNGTYKAGELAYILDGNLPDRFNLDQTITYNSPGFIL